MSSAATAQGPGRVPAGPGLTDLVDTVSTRYLFITGKGGVGKTSTACATAVALADRGRSVLLVSTDPASNLDEVLGTRLGSTPTPVPGVPGLDGLNVDPERAAAAYRDRVLGPVRGLLPPSAIARIEEQLSGACTVEIAAFDAFTALLTDTPVTAGYDHVVFDTAPTGHTLRLLALPAAWTTFIGDGTGTSCLGPLSGMAAQQDTYTQALAALTDPAATTLLLITRPDRAALAEAARAGTELRAIGMTHQQLIVNGVFTAAPGRDDPLAAALHAQAHTATGDLPAALAGLPRTTLPLRTVSPLGITELRRFAAGQDNAPAAGQPGQDPMSCEPVGPLGTASFQQLIDTITAAGSGLVMTMGKGGVGKTTVAAAVAVALADRGHPVKLSTTDPAAHIAAALGATVPGVTVTRIDPVAETAAYTAQTLATAGRDLDDEARAVLAEDLASPCTEEIAVFQAFARTVAAAQDGFVVLDTAPTGHTLLLLDAARTYHQELARQSGQLPDSVTGLLDRLRDPDRTHVLIVAVPEATPVHEAARLQADLVRTGITPTGWVLNQSLAAAAPTDPVLAARAAGERRYIDEVTTALSDRVVVLPRTPDSPTGPDLLRALVTEPALAGATGGPR